MINKLLQLRDITMPHKTFEELMQIKFNQRARDILESLAHDKYSRAEAAKKLDCSLSTISVYANKYGIKFENKSPNKVYTPKPTTIDPKALLNKHAKLTLSKKWV